MLLPRKLMSHVCVLDHPQVKGVFKMINDLGDDEEEVKPALPPNKTCTLGPAAPK